MNGELSPHDGGALWRLAVAMHAKFYPEARDWEPGADVDALISQIDNMASGLERKKACEDCGGCGYVTFGDGAHMNGNLPCPTCNLEEIANTLKAQRDELRQLSEGMAAALEFEKENYPTWWSYAPMSQKSLTEFRRKFRSLGKQQPQTKEQA